MTVKQVNRELKPIQRWEIEPGGQLYFHNSDLQLRPQTVIEKVCTIFKRVRPVVVFLSEFWLVPKKWKDSLKQFTALLDSLCPAQ